MAESPGGVRLAAVVVIMALTAACSGAGTSSPTSPVPAITTTTVGATSTTQTTGTTTTARAADVVDGADPDLSRMIVDFYRDAGVQDPIRATASVDVVEDVRVAVIQSGADVLAAIDEGDGWRLVAGSAPSVDVDAWFGGPRVVAVVGSDARPGEDPARSRSDSVHLVAFDGESSVTVVGIPRDTFGPVPGFGEQKLAAALSLGGPGTLRATLESLAGFELDGQAITGFEGFRQIAGQILGGINITLDEAVRDPSSGSDFDQGFQYMNGFQALAFARARKTIEDGDFGRQRNGGLVLIALLGTLHLRGPAALPGYLAATSPWIVTDLPIDEQLSLGLAALTIDPASVTNLVLPGRATTRDGSSIVLLDPEAQDILADLADGSLDG
jgi:LCP family protein required for cell wall assembly